MDINELIYDYLHRKIKTLGINKIMGLTYRSNKYLNTVHSNIAQNA